MNPPMTAPTANNSQFPYRIHNVIRERYIALLLKITSFLSCSFLPELRKRCALFNTHPSSSAAASTLTVHVSSLIWNIRCARGGTTSHPVIHWNLSSLWMIFILLLYCTCFTKFHILITLWIHLRQNWFTPVSDIFSFYQKLVRCYLTPNLSLISMWCMRTVQVQCFSNINNILYVNVQVL